MRVIVWLQSYGWQGVGREIKFRHFCHPNPKNRCGLIMLYHCSMIKCFRGYYASMCMYLCVFFTSHQRVVVFCVCVPALILKTWQMLYYIFLWILSFYEKNRTVRTIWRTCGYIYVCVCVLLFASVIKYPALFFNSTIQSNIQVKMK